MISTSAPPITILHADDDDDDRLLVRDALREARMMHELRFVEDGEELLDYLHQRGRYAPEGAAPRPGLVLLDLNMPKMDGREALASIKADTRLRRIPVIVLTTSTADDDVVRTYDLGANSFISKPVTFDALVHILRGINAYWFEIVQLPREPRD